MTRSRFCKSSLPLAASALCAAGLAVLAMPAAHAQNLLTNGSFELGTFAGTNPQGAANTTQLAAGSTAMTGWTVTPGSDISWEINGNPYGFIATDGTHSLDLTGYQDAAPYGGVSQTMALAQGGTYRLSFDLGANSTYSGATSLRAVVGNVDQTFTFTPDAAGPASQFGTFTTTFFANTASTTLQLTGASSGAPGDYIGLDHVSVTFVSGGASAPEPGSFALLGASLLPVAGLVARRRIRKVAH